MPTKLKGLKIDEGSLVDKGANQLADIVLFKRDNTDVKERLFDMVKSLFSKSDIQDTDSELADTFDELAKAGRKISGNRMTAIQEMKTLMDKASAMMQSMMDEIDDTKGSDTMTDDMKKGLSEDVIKHIEELEAKVAKVDTLEAELAKKDEPIDVLKGASEEVKKMVEDLQKKVTENEEIAKVEREARITKEFEAKGSEFPHLGEAGEIGSMLRKAYDISDDEGKKLEETLKAANAKIDANDRLTKEIGKAGGSVSEPFAKIESAIAEIVAKNSVTKEQAMTDFLNTDVGKKLYEEFEAERSVQ